MRRWLLFAAMAAFTACPPPPGPADGGTDSGTDGLVHCLDSPNTIVQAPSGQLPCELLPPGFKQ